MRKINTLKKNYEFKNVIKKGQFFVRKHIIIYLTKNNKNKNIIGIAINTKLCNAVKRNRIKNYKYYLYSYSVNNLLIFSNNQK